jgi:hypothetical protein
MTTATKFTNIDQFLTLFKGVKPDKTGWIALCPGHIDHDRSLHIKLTEDGKILLNCFAGCENGHIVETVGLTLTALFLSKDKQGKITTAVYNYEDVDRNVIYQVCRTLPKGFYQRRPDGNGGYINDLKGVTHTIYHLPDILTAIANSEPLIVNAEGEKDCDNCFTEFTIPATCNSGGAGKWKSEYGDFLKGAQTVVVIADKDSAGRDHAKQVSDSLLGKVKAIKVIEMPGGGVKDLSDWIEQGGDREAFINLVNQSPEYKQPKKESTGMLTLAQFREQVHSLKSEDDLIQDILPNSPSDYLMICGRPGIGKTNEILHMGFCLATGTKWYSHPCKRCRVGYIAFEGAQTKLLGRLDKLCMTYPEAEIGDYFKLNRVMPFKLTGDGIKDFERYASGLDVVILDPIKYCIAGDYTKSGDANAFLSILKELAVKLHVVPILIHHVRKPDKRVQVKPADLMFEVKGAGDYVEGANTVLLMERARQTRGTDGKFGSHSEDAVLHFCKVKDSPAEMLPLKLRLDRETLLFKQQIDTEEYDADED